MGQRVPKIVHALVAAGLSRGKGAGNALPVLQGRKKAESRKQKAESRTQKLSIGRARLSKMLGVSRAQVQIKVSGLKHQDRATLASLGSVSKGTLPLKVAEGENCSPGW